MVKKYIAFMMSLVMLLSCCFVFDSFAVKASEVSQGDAAKSETDIPTIKFEELRPTLTASAAGYDSIKLSWGSIDGAVKYEVWRTASKNEKYTLIETLTGTEYTDSSVAFNSKYYYKVRARGAKGEKSLNSYAASAKASLSRVNGFKGENTASNKIKLSWDKVNGANGYTIYRASSINGEYKAVVRVTKGTTLTWTNSSLTHGRTYYYKVRAYRNVNGQRIYGDYCDIIAVKARLPKPTLTLTRSSYTISVKWSKVTGATGYKLYRATSIDGEYKLLGSTSSSKRTFANSSVVPGVTYYYKVAAIKNGVEGALSDIKSETPVMAKPASPKASSTSGGIKLSWNSVSGAKGYVIYRSGSADGEFAEIGRTTEKTYTDSGTMIGRTYYYKIAAYRTSSGLTGVGALSSAVSAKANITAPTISSAGKHSSNSIKIGWKASGGADGYYIYRSTSSGGTYTKIGQTDSDTLFFIDEGRVKNKSYYYKVRAYVVLDGEKVFSSYSASRNARITNKVAYLTFDDGPSSNTMRILDILDKYGVKATFFVIGKSGRDKEYKAIVDRGHTIALHTYSHEYSKVYASEKAFFKEIEKISDKVYNLTGVRSNIIRFPGGSSNTVYKKYCRGLMAKLKKSVPAKGYFYHDWNVSSGDANGNNIAKNKLINNVKGGCKNKTVVNILMHDTGSAKNTTVSALPAIIEYLLAQGYDIQPITEDSTLIQH